MFVRRQKGMFSLKRLSGIKWFTQGVNYTGLIMMMHPRRGEALGGMTANPRLRFLPYSTSVLTTTTSPRKEEEQKEAPVVTVWLAGALPLLLPPFARSIYASRILAQPSRYPFLPALSPSSSGSTPTETTNTTPRKIPHFPDLRIQPNVKEGGIFLHSFNPSLFDEVDRLTRINGSKSLWFFPVTAHLVKGRPWIEDLMARRPSNYLKVQFLGGGPDVPIEDLYRDFRPFGRIRNIIPQSSIDKELPRYAIIQFNSIRAATCARNCIHGELIDSTRLGVLYEPHPYFASARSWLASNTRIVILFLVGLVAGLSYVVFDPIRILSIKLHLAGKFELFNTFFSQLSSFFRVESGISDLFVRDEDVARLSSLLLQPPESMILVYGEKGDVVRQALSSTITHSITVDCSALANQPESVVRARLASQLHYHPAFSTFASASNVLDTIITASTGAKAGLGTTLQADVNKMLEAVSIAAHEIVNAQIAQREIAQQSLERSISDGLDASSITIPEIQYPVIIFQDFMSLDPGSSASSHASTTTMIQDLIAQWAAIATENHLANVVFVSANPAAAKRLEGFCVRKPLQLIAVSDVSKAQVVDFISKRLNLPVISSDLEDVLDKLGGRSADLELLVAKMRSGLSPREALDDIIMRSVGELRKVAILPDKPQPFTPIQFWAVMEALCKMGKSHQPADVLYDTLRFSPLFRGDDTALLQMERAGLIAFKYENGRPYKVTPFRPIHRLAFQSMLNDKPLVTTMSLLTIKALSAVEQGKVSSYQAELETLTDSFSKGSWSLTGRSKAGIKARIEFLIGEMTDSANKLEKWCKAEKLLKKSLA